MSQDDDPRATPSPVLVGIECRPEGVECLASLVGLEALEHPDDRADGGDEGVRSVAVATELHR